MRKLFIATLTSGALMAAAVIATAPPAQATHGCIDLGDVVMVHGDTNAPDVPGGLLPPCTFVYATGDTYSGVGTFNISCPLGTGTANYNTSPATQVPFDCNPGSTVTVTAPSGFVAAGSAT